MKKLFIGIFILGLTNLAYSQSSKSVLEVELDGITVTPLNIDYFHKVKEGTISENVLNLENMAATFDITKSPLFNNHIPYYEVNFTQPYGQILATYDGHGKLVRSYERFKNIPFPVPVRNSIYRAYPGWTVKGNTYLVSYYHDRDLKKVYRVQIGKGSLKKNLKIDSLGNLM
jgi:hypothetical protein